MVVTFLFGLAVILLFAIIAVIVVRRSKKEKSV